MMLTTIGFILLLFFTLICGCVQDPSWNNATPANTPENKIVFNDSFGNRIELSHTASRIVSGKSDVTEMLITIGAVDKIIGVDGQSFERLMNKLPPDVTNLGAYSPLNVEGLLQLKTDAVVTYGSYPPANIDKVRALNITVVHTDCYRLDDLNMDAYVLGELTGDQEGARKYVEFNKRYRALIESRLDNLTPDEIPTVYGTYKTPTGQEYILPGDCSFGYLMNAIHARNVNGDLKASSPIVSPEWIFQKDPDIIFIIGYFGYFDCYGEPGADSLRSVRDIFKNRTGYEKLKAVQSDRIYVYSSGFVGGPRSTIGLVYFAKVLYPDHFTDIDPDAVRREYAELFGFCGDEPGIEWFYPPFEPVNVTPTGGHSTTQR